MELSDEERRPKFKCLYYVLEPREEEDLSPALSPIEARGSSPGEMPQVPVPAKTTAMVRRMIWKSSQTLQLSM